MKPVWTFITLALFQCVAGKVDYLNGEEFTVSKETLIERLNKRVATSIDLVDKSRTAINTEYKVYQSKDSAVKETSFEVQEGIASKINDFNNQLGKIKDDDDCKKTNVSDSIQKYKEEAQSQYNKFVTDYNEVVSKETIPQGYNLLVTLYEGAQSPLGNLVSRCSREHSLANHLILACVGFGIQDFQKKFTQAELKTTEWRVSKTNVIKAAEDATKKLKSLIDVGNFDNIRVELQALKDCLDNKTPEETPEKTPEGNPEEIKSIFLW